ncbi:MAG TPA: LuxR C-terminal-related transcriptional regulator, partial [Chitinophagales bacterium]|nr:LuxR C-terminal-related transcriptional regulator [Chitinophagales bacterium]
DKSAKYYYEQLRIANEHNYKFGMAKANFNLGTNYLQCRQYQKAEQFYSKALFYLKESRVNDNSFLVNISIELSKSEFYQKNYQKAERRLLDLLRLNDFSPGYRIDDRLNIYIALSELYLGKNDIEKSLLFSKQAVLLKDSTNSNFLKILVLQNVRNILINQKKWQDALEAAYNEEHFVKGNRMDYSMNSLMKKVRILDALGKKEELLKVYKQMFQAKERTAFPLILSNVTGYEMNYELAQLKRQKEIELLLEKNEKKLFRLQSYLYLSVALLLLISLTALIVRTKNKNKLANLKIEKEIAEKQLAYQKLQLNNASLTEFALHAEHMQDRLAELKNKVNEALSTGNFEKEKLYQIKNEISIEFQNPALNTVELNNKVKSIKDELMFKLSRAHPSLTDKDKRLCVLLMLNLSSKEMAGILNIQEESVEKSRSRLRKKMNLTSTQNFIEYFNSMT